MNDIVDSEKRSSMMARVGGRNTKPEMRVRRYLHACGFRYRLHRRDLPGSPDLVLPKYRVVIFVHGCFWHRHSGCRYATEPSTRPQFWSEKFSANVARDKRNIDQLRKLGWRVFVIWECVLRHAIEDLETLPSRLQGNETVLVWPTEPPRPWNDRS